MPSRETNNKLLLLKGAIFYPCKILYKNEYLIVSILETFFSSMLVITVLKSVFYSLHYE